MPYANLKAIIPINRTDLTKKLRKPRMGKIQTTKYTHAEIIIFRSLYEITNAVSSQAKLNISKCSLTFLMLLFTIVKNLYLNIIVIVRFLFKGWLHYFALLFDALLVVFVLKKVSFKHSTSSDLHLVFINGGLPE